VKTKGRFGSALLNLLPAQLESVQFLGLLHNHFTQARELMFLLEGDPETRGASEDAFPRPGQSRALGVTDSKNFLFAYARRKGPNQHCGLRENWFLTPFATVVYRKTAPALQACCLYE
jgi:hypothetical protein